MIERFIEGVEAQVLSEGIHVSGILWPVGTTLRYKEDRPFEAIIAKDIKVYGITWVPGTVFHFSKKGKVKRIDPEGALYWDGLLIPPGTRFYPRDGRIKKIRTWRHFGYEGYVFQDGIMAQMDGKILVSAKLRRSSNFLGYNFEEDTVIKFNKASKVESITLGRPQKLDGTKFEKGHEFKVKDDKILF